MRVEVFGFRVLKLRVYSLPTYTVCEPMLVLRSTRPPRDQLRVDLKVLLGVVPNVFLNKEPMSIFSSEIKTVAHMPVAVI